MNSKFSFLLLWLIMSASLFAANFQVINAGYQYLNGLYVESGTENGKPKYIYGNSY